MITLTLDLTPAQLNSLSSYLEDLEAENMPNLAHIVDEISNAWLGSDYDKSEAILND